MAQLDHLEALTAGQRLLTGDANLPEDDLRVFAGDRIVVDDEDAHLMRMRQAFLGDAVDMVGIAQRHDDGECRSDTLLALHLNLAVHQLDDTLGDRHAEAGAAILMCR